MTATTRSRSGIDSNAASSAFAAPEVLAETPGVDRALRASLERIVAGPERKSRLISDQEKVIIAFHEGGHAVVQRILPKCDPVQKVTIISRGMALGYTMALPTEDRYLQSKSEFEDKIAGLLGGNAAERLIFGDTTTGASNDIEKATMLARRMVTERRRPCFFLPPFLEPFLATRRLAPPSKAKSFSRF